MQPLFTYIPDSLKSFSTIVLLPALAGYLISKRSPMGEVDEAANPSGGGESWRMMKITKKWILAL